MKKNLKFLVFPVLAAVAFLTPWAIYGTEQDEGSPREQRNGGAPQNLQGWDGFGSEEQSTIPSETPEELEQRREKTRQIEEAEKSRAQYQIDGQLAAQLQYGQQLPAPDAQTTYGMESDQKYPEDASNAPMDQVDHADPFGLATPDVLARVMDLALKDVQNSSAPLLLCEEVKKQAAQEAIRLLNITNDFYIYPTDQLPLSVRDIIAGYVRVPQSDDPIEAENAMVVAAVIRSLATVTACIRPLETLLISLHDRLQAQNLALNPCTMEGSVSIRQNNKYLRSLAKFREFIADAGNTLLDVGRATPSGYFRISIIHSLNERNPVWCNLSTQGTVDDFKQFCRERQLLAGKIIRALNKAIEAYSDLASSSDWDSNPFKVLHLAQPIIGLNQAQLSSFERLVTSHMIKEAMTESIEQFMRDLIYVHLFSNFNTTEHFSQIPWYEEGE
jgi:hypothetical protein